MINSPLVHQLANQWAKRELRFESGDQERLRRMFLRGVGREVLPEEQEYLLDKIQSDRASRVAEAKIWSDVAHIIFNLNEFLFIR